MENDYDRKFEEMKNYIPFLENMIKRLESTGVNSSNPRQAQLDKIRSLRDLLLDRKKRMKMENLLKCEQVLINLYAKVEQRDTLPGIQKAFDVSSNSKPNLNIARSKLKTVTAAIKVDPDTLPEIARASEVEAGCSPGSKLPALFQRRPNMSPPRHYKSSIDICNNMSPQSAKRNYTRVLVSPEPSSRDWSSAKNNISDPPLFSRRSPRRSPKRHLPAYTKRERKKTLKQRLETRKDKDFNILLNVPEERLNSLDTTDILSRIINCHDGDVDIHTLRELRTQILGELKQTGVNEDISDLILKSYKTKRVKTKSKVDVEEGEISDSESEAIDNIYGSLVILEKDQNKKCNKVKTSEKDDEPRKIQIRLVINSDKEKNTSNSPMMDLNKFDLEMYDKSVDKLACTSDCRGEKKQIGSSSIVNLVDKEITNKQEVIANTSKTNSIPSIQDVITIEDEDGQKEHNHTKDTSKEVPALMSGDYSNIASTSVIDISNVNKSTSNQGSEKINVDPGNTGNTNVDFENTIVGTEKIISDIKKENTDTEKNNIQTEKKYPDTDRNYDNSQRSNTDTKKANAASEKTNTDSNKKIADSEVSHPDTYKTFPNTQNPIIPNISQKPDTTTSDITFKPNFYKPMYSEDQNTQSEMNMNQKITTNLCVENILSENKSQIDEIPLLNDPTNPPPAKEDVVSEIDILQALKNEILSETIAIPNSEVSTPALHQPKVTKVINAKEITSKKRISIEKYKQKSESSSSTTSLFLKKSSKVCDENSRKQSLKLTEKECERFFNLRDKFHFDSSSEEEQDKNDKTLDDIYGNLAPRSPDADMLSNLGNVSPVIIPEDPVKNIIVNAKHDIDMRNLVPNKSTKSTANWLPMQSPRQTDTTKEHPPNDLNPHDMNSTSKSRMPLLDPRIRREINQNITASPNAHCYPDRTPIHSKSINYPNRTPNRTPNARSYEMTPKHYTFDENTSGKHVYAPILPVCDQYLEKSVTKEPHWDVNDPTRRSSFESDIEMNHKKWDEHNLRNGSGAREFLDNSRFKDASKYDKYGNIIRYKADNLNRSEGLLKMNSFGRLDCPATPTPSFGRQENSVTPVHSFVRSDCPTTPTPSFGRHEVPLIPVSPIGRSECSLGPSHNFGRSESLSTPTPSFGRQEASSTPIHSYSRSECPTTPIHPFGRSDVSRTPTHALGRSEYIQKHLNTNQRFHKDPRLHRSSESNHDYDKNYGRNDRDYNRGTTYSDLNNRSLKQPDSYRGNSQQGGKNSRDYPRDISARNYSQRDSSVGRTVSRDRDSEKFYSRDRNKRFDAFDGRSLQREHSIGRSLPSDQIYRSTRAASIGRNYQENCENTLSVKSHAGRSFTIDTSVNRTFQQFIDRQGLLDTPSDLRRERARSVGRALVRESSVGRTLIRESSVERNVLHIDTIEYNHTNVGNKFRRACSVGRDLVAHQKECSLSEVKAQFQSYLSCKSKSVPSQDKARDISDYQRKGDTRNENKIPKYVVPRSRKEIYERERSENIDHHSRTSIYSPRKNLRDPRMRKEQDKDLKKLSRDEYRKDLRYRHNYGIVYSNDNIAKGVLGAGSGVKNYKIPKIKRPEKDLEEQENEHLSEKGNNNKNKSNVETSEKVDGLKLKLKISSSDNRKEDNDCNISTVNRLERKITRSNKSNITESKIKDDDEIVRTRRRKKGVIYDSDDEHIEKNDKDLSMNIDHEHKVLSPAKKITPANSPQEQKSKKENEDVVDSSFSLEDLDVFSDNIVPDPVVDNINALIADLDNDIETPKSGDGSKQFANEFSIETLFINKDKNSKTIEQDTLCVTNNFINKDLRPDETKPVENSSISTDHAFVNNKDIASDNDKRTITDTNKDIRVDVSVHKQNICDSEIHQLEETLTISHKPADKNTKNICEDGPVSKDNIDQKIDAQVGSEISSSVENLKSEETLFSKTDPKSNEIQISESDFQSSDLLIKTGQINDLHPSEETNVRKNSIDNDDIVTTTDIKNDDVKINEINNQENNFGNNFDMSSIPDSTIDTEERKNDVSPPDLPDSTNEKNKDLCIDVSSTVKNNNEITDSISHNKHQVVPQSDPFTSLLSILQDKSKIKELLNMLGNQSSENEKMKKKLEKLSAIVSDEDDIEDVNTSRSSKNVKKLPDTISLSKEDEISVADNESEATPLQTNKNNEAISQVQNEDEKLIDETCKQRKPDSLNMNMSDKSAIDSPKVQHNESVISSQNNEDQDQSEKYDVNLEDFEAKSTVLKKTSTKKTKVGKKNKRKGNKNKAKVKRITRSESRRFPEKSNKKKGTELERLQDDIREMFISDEVLNATGIRNCRLAKLVDDNSHRRKEIPESNDSEPRVVLEKVVNTVEGKLAKKNMATKSIRKKPGPKPKPKICENSHESNDSQDIANYIPGPKSKKRIVQMLEHSDPYAFETDSNLEEKSLKDNDQSLQNTSDSESDSAVSTRSHGSSELFIDIKKKKRKRGWHWKSGIIKSKSKKKKSENKIDEVVTNVDANLNRKEVYIPDANCFTDKTYCFLKNVFTYSCRLCIYSGSDIVHHYKKYHPHSEIPLSRMSPEIAKEAIEQCEEINFVAISKIPSDKYVCRFCFAEFSKKRPLLETFFWHVVSTHTGEYKQLCSECINETRCPFNLDIPPPPKDEKRQLIGYICGKCNYTQISLENLKTHVIDRHNDEQTEVYTINLAVMSRKTVNILSKRYSLSNASENDSIESPRTLRSSRVNQSTELKESDMDENSECNSEENLVYNATKKNRRSSLQRKRFSKIQSKIYFETDDSISEKSNTINMEETLGDSVKKENDQIERSLGDESINEEPEVLTNAEIEKPVEIENQDGDRLSDVILHPHFKINVTKAGGREYVCCVNGKDNHFKTSMTISIKKHVQVNHKKEKWDGYCYVCKVIITSQGLYSFNDCLQHYLDKHMDNFPILENSATKEPDNMQVAPVLDIQEVKEPPRSYINVRPISELMLPMSESVNHPIQVQTTLLEERPILPKIASVVSLGSPVDQPSPSAGYPVTRTEPLPLKEYKYEEWQTEIMAQKHRVVLSTMMNVEKMAHVYKCAGRFCSYTCDSAENAILHASAHQRVGGENALRCAYCDFDPLDNAIDLVMHVFNSHGMCQYSCELCFYRAVASQLVGAHAKRAHPNSPLTVVLRCTSISTPPADVSNMLPREIAVPFIECNLENSEGGMCQFRTYTPNKFYEHLQLKHIAVEIYVCNDCKCEMKTAAELVHHKRNHGLKLYQCTRCVHGADTEAELLAHASAKHPNKQPQAYLRIITNRDGELRTLPMAQFSKAKVATQDVSSSNEALVDPIRDAERSIELEKLIGLTTAVESASKEPTVENISEAVPRDIQPSNLISNVPELPKLPTLSLVTSSSAISPALSVPCEHSTTIVKKSPDTPEKSLSSDVIYSLDSDEEDSKQGIIGIIDLSNDDTQTSSSALDKGLENTNTTKDNPQTLSLKELLQPNDSSNNNQSPEQVINKCYKCHIFFERQGDFEGHIIWCYSHYKNKESCPVCAYKCDDELKFLTHIHACTTKRITRISRDKSSRKYTCSVCNAMSDCLPDMKTHVKKQHSISKINVTSNIGEKGEISFLVQEYKKPKGPAPKRKLSASISAKQKRYGPEDVDQLPINPILDELVYCSVCEFSTKVRVNMVRHLQQHAFQQPVAQTAPVNPVPHLETNERHFDKMINLASSSLVARGLDKLPKSDTPSNATKQMSPELISNYPKFVQERQRHTCGATGCSYISVDEAMLKYHWETLHAGTNDFRCVHCPTNQSLDKTRPISAVRIISHLKMHDVNLYACSLCDFYHHRRILLEKHLNDVHDGKGQVVIIREESTAMSSVTAQPSTSAPTMDLKPWQCGLCQFKSMLRPDVVEHCAKQHNITQAKMQFKCTYCPFRTSTIDNVTKHQSASHAGRPSEVFYFYYREGSIPENPDGTPRWKTQKAKMPQAANLFKEVKSEEKTPDSPVKNRNPPNQLVVDLNVVKQEISEELSPDGNSLEILCKKYGQFCEPNGLRYRCPLCKIISEDCKDAMQSHLYEELRYRKWACRICSYKAFHKKGLEEHMTAEHRINADPIDLPANIHVEAWVSKLLEHQAAIIQKNRENFAKQRIQVDRQTPQTSKPNPTPVEKLNVTSNITDKDVEHAFGSLGSSRNMLFCCPKCDYSVKEEAAIQDHLETELSKIRWGCNICSFNFQTYHEAQFHCKSKHIGQSARPIEAIRDPLLRAAWVAAVIRVQKSTMSLLNSVSIVPENEPEEDDESSGPDNSLLVVRYEEKVPTPEQHSVVKHKRRAGISIVDDCESRLIINEDSNDDHDIEQKKTEEFKCPHCIYTTITKNRSSLKYHILSKHYNLSSYICAYCEFGHHQRNRVVNHQTKHHSNLVSKVLQRQIPNYPPLDPNEYNKVICIKCVKDFTVRESHNHIHNDDKTYFINMGNVLPKCVICNKGFKDCKSVEDHHSDYHLGTPFVQKYHKLYGCGVPNCNKRYTNFHDYRQHHEELHKGLELSLNIMPLSSDQDRFEDHKRTIAINKRPSEDISILPPLKRVAKKSTSKLPNKAIAKKSTTKLPYYDEYHSESDEEYSFYGTKPATLEQYANVTTMMPFCNTMMPFTLKKFCEIININPKVIVKKED